MPVPNRQEQRREYLKKKGIAYAITCVCTFVFIELVLRMVRWLTEPYPIGCPVGEKPPLPYLPHLIVRIGGVYAVEGVVSFLVLLALAFFCARTCKRQWKHASAIPYVPPVSKNQWNPPAEEVLVRGSQEPTQEQSTVLLRATEESADVPTGELLRATSAGTNKG